jgi:hypothetical protein
VGEVRGAGGLREGALLMGRAARRPEPHGVRAPSLTACLGRPLQTEPVSAPAAQQAGRHRRECLRCGGGVPRRRGEAGAGAGAGTHSTCCPSTPRPFTLVLQHAFWCAECSVGRSRRPLWHCSCAPGGRHSGEREAARRGQTWRRARAAVCWVAARGGGPEARRLPPQAARTAGSAAAAAGAVHRRAAAAERRTRRAACHRR